jgi:site-specific DNA-methyltransferase (adenine-specific)
MVEINRRFNRRFNLPEGKKYKSNVLEYKKDYTGHHPTQKPVLLMEDLIKTYTNEAETVLDFTMGSGTTGVAAKNLNRSFIGIELDETYFEIAKQRISVDNSK